MLSSLTVRHPLSKKTHAMDATPRSPPLKNRPQAVNGRKGWYQITGTILVAHRTDLRQDVDDGTAAVEEGMDLVLAPRQIIAGSNEWSNYVKLSNLTVIKQETTHMLYVWYIYLHLSQWGKCWYSYSSTMERMG